MVKITQEDCFSLSRKGKHINESERQQIEYCRLKGMSVTQVATLLQRHRSTAYQELKRGTEVNKRSDWSEFRVYRAQRTQNDYLRNSGAGEPYLKRAWNSKEDKRLHTFVTVNKMSSYVAIQTARQEKMLIPFSEISLYRYIHQYNYPIASCQMPMKNKRKKNKQSSPQQLAHHMLTPFHRLNEEVTKMQTVSLGASYPRKQHSIRLHKTMSTVWSDG